MTNREWINSLSNEDLVMEIIALCGMCANEALCGMCANEGKNCTEHSEMNCYEGCEKWLEQEHEGSGNE